MSSTYSSGMHVLVEPEIRTFELSSIQLTENGYTPEFEAEILAEAEECYAAVANGTAKSYKNAAELRAALDAEDEDE